MENIVNSSTTQLVTSPERFIWDVTYACPLRCIHCYSESGRRPARMLERKDMLRVVEAIIRAKPKRISFAGGEPLLAPWWDEAAALFSTAGIPVTMFLSGWVMNDDVAARLATTVAGVTVSVDGPNSQVHDRIRGRAGSFDRAMATLDRLNRLKQKRASQGQSCYRLGIEYTVMRSGKSNLGTFVEKASARFSALDDIRFGAVIPGGLAQEVEFVESELLADDELEALVESETTLIAHAKNGVQASVTDVRSFLPSSPLSAEGATIAQVEPDGSLRAFPLYEAKVGNLLEEPIEVLWKRALAWRNDPFVLEQLSSIQTLTDWARVTRILDRRFGSEADKARIARRSTVGTARLGV
ncbi:radical SAM protein [Rugosimonospora africana]|uniref:Radical SAM protein n=1 Tax=Rugosimonospora africana TaxID=556532 RepID=A0A8J3QYV1_9ACTN|nr:radical SAM protein [Rugosimonospora africana]GIH19413.1 radical SAM protein [Rugosimonospora africana]